MAGIVAMAVTVTRLPVGDPVGVADHRISVVNSADGYQCYPPAESHFTFDDQSFLVRFA
jgi:hypothetical protein